MHQFMLQHCTIKKRVVRASNHNNSYKCAILYGLIKHIKFLRYFLKLCKIGR